MALLNVLDMMTDVVPHLLLVQTFWRNQIIANTKELKILNNFSFSKSPSATVNFP